MPNEEMYKPQEPKLKSVLYEKPNITDLPLGMHHTKKEPLRSNMSERKR